MTRANARTPVKLHRNVTLIRASEPLVAEELMARKSLARLVLARLSDTVLLVKPDAADAAVAELRKMGQTPKIAR